MSDVITLRSAAKINLTLDVMGKDHSSRKHFVNTILYRLEEPHDELTLTRRDDDQIMIHCDMPGVGMSEHNTVYKALTLLGEKGWDVRIHKEIPIQAGLGGGSGNAAAVLKYFGQQKGLPEHVLQDLAQQIGADVPFFLLEENLAYAEGFGDQILQAWTIPTLPIALVVTGVSLSTAEAYASLDPDRFGEGTEKTEAVLQLLKEQGTLSAQELKPLVHNAFEVPFFQQFPPLKGQAHLCGSGGMMWEWKTSR